MTGITYDALSNDWAITVDTASGEQHEGWAATAGEAAARLEEAVAKWARHEALHNWQVARALEIEATQAAQHTAQNTQKATPVALPAPSESPAQKPAGGMRCAHYKSIRRAFAIAREAGLDTKADEAMRAAFSHFLGRAVETREALSGGDWMLVGNAIKARRLAW